MKNYYQETLDTIKGLIKEGNKEEAEKLVIVELSMPYVPEPYLSEFEVIRDELAGHDVTNMFYTDIESIHRALLGDEMTQAKAVVSLEHMNLRAVQEDLIDMLENGKLDDMGRRYILMVAMEQELDLSVSIELDQKLVNINTKTLENPFNSKKVIEIYEDLVSRYESNNPSFLQFCMEELNMQLLNSFPFVSDNLSAQYIVDRVNTYFN